MKRASERKQRATGICTECNQGPANTFKTRVKVRGLVKRGEEKTAREEKRREKKEEEEKRDKRGGM